MKELLLNNSRLDERYDIQNILGRGSYAEIYVARDTLAAPQSPHKSVVIKALNVFLQNDLDTDLERTLVENFQNEAIALDRVRHPNIISRLGHGTARDLRGTIFHYLVLEYLPGGDLAKSCREKSLSLTEALFYIEQVCAGIGHAHQNGIIHRDIKPQNLLLTADRQTVKIADFGVARVTQSDSPVTRVGTNMFAPPEHSPLFAGHTGTLTFTKLTPAADIYSLAKSAYVLVTCESPRFFTNQPITELPFTMRQKPWASDLVKVLTRATQNDSRMRYQTVNDFWQDLSRIKLLAENEDRDAETKTLDAPHKIPQPHVAKGYTPNAPQQPRFNTSRDLKLKNNFSVAESAPLVVRIENQKFNQSLNSQLQPVVEEGIPVYEELPRFKEKAKQKSLRRFAAFIIFLGLFAGILYGTHNYLRGGGILPQINNPFRTQSGKTNTDLNLRPAPSTKNDPIGMAPKDSLVKILSSSDNWYEIKVIEYSRPKENPDFVDRGWVNAKYIDVEE
ncbi:MAG TPA: serine/threonine protein kinase [Pyrinomonadaceae bacterium]|nr:serine/threonine protein kinase [Pyrinomonadaceae bacterium]